jgi:hypothetical protein
MQPLKRVLLFFVLPLVAVFLFPPASLQNANVLLLGLVIAFFIALGAMLWNGYTLILTLSIFVQGMNVIVRLMMFFQNAVDKTSGIYNPAFIVTMLAGLALSFYLMLRYDQLDVRGMMFR